MLILMSNKQKQILYMSLEKPVPWMSPSDHLELLVCYGDQLILLTLV